MKVIFLLLSILFLQYLSYENTFDVTKLKISRQTDQIMIVVPKDHYTYSGFFYYYIKKENKWIEIMSTEAHLGKNGLGKQIQGDKKTPVGVYSFNCYFGINDNPGTKLPYVKLNESYYWQGDSYAERYNQLVNIETFKDFDTDECEHLIEETLGYKYAMNINYNEKGIPFKGAGIFLYCFTENPYTAGCVALSEADMIRVFRNVNKNTLILIDYIENIYNY